MNKIEEKLLKIRGLDKKAMDNAKNFLDNLCKPLGSLGTLEDIVIQLCGIREEMVYNINKKTIVIMCSDNGIVEEGVSSCPKEVTATVTENFIKGTTGVCALSKFFNSDLTVVDIGVDKDFLTKDIINKKIMYGTRNMIKGPAMSRQEAIKAIECGIEIVEELVGKGYDLIGTGEMGIGNTTTSATVIAALTDLDSELIVGRGSGLTEEALEKKKDIVKKVLEINKPNKDDAIDVISKVGGLDIAGLCGVFLGGAIYRVPIVVDGLISSAAALCAFKLCNESKDFMIPSHLSKEPGADYVMKELGLNPMLNLGMRLGEGTGCTIAFSIIESAIYTANNMESFENSGVIKDDYENIWNEE